MVNPVSLRIRAKKLGVLIKDARITACKSVSECAQAMGIPDEAYEAYEMGDHSPSLPELEMLAYFLKIPLDHFWRTEIQSAEQDTTGQINPKVLLNLRQRVVGTLLRKARLEAKIELGELSAKTGLPAEIIELYEFGEKPVPVPELEVLAVALGQSANNFQDQRGPVGMWMAQQRAIQEFKELSPELQSFVCKPVNWPYLELAQRLSEMSVEKLRAVAEGLLEITL